MWPFGSSDGGGNQLITDETATYNDDGELLCPRCETVYYTVGPSIAPYDDRTLNCKNCGYRGYIEDGVVIYRD